MSYSTTTLAMGREECAGGGRSHALPQHKERDIMDMRVVAIQFDVCVML